jgi:hypothetical protein
MNGTDERVQAIAACEDALHRGEPLAAYNAAQSALERWPSEPRLRQLQALALARSGDTERANAALRALADEGLDDAETLGMLARTHKDLAFAAAEAASRSAHLEEAFMLYRRGAENAAERADLDGACYAGINAASLALVRGDANEAHALARRVRAWSASMPEAGGGWRDATLGEAALILGEADVARGHYERAAVAARGRPGDLASSRRQVRLLAPHLPPWHAEATAALRVPPVVAFTGHMVDAPERVSPRFPASLERTVAGRIRDRLAAIAPLAVYSSAACGADLLCLEAARELGIETHVVLPFPQEAFRAASVAFAGASWEQRLATALESADSVTVTSDHAARGSAASFDYANLVLTGAARLRAHALETDLVGLAACEDEHPSRPGGSADLLRRWRDAGIAVERIPISDAPSAPSHAAPSEPAPATAPRHEMRALLFADAVGYSKLTEDQIPGYIEGFLGAVAAYARASPCRYEHVETAGDGLYMVFREVADAGRFALGLSRVANEFDRAAWGLPPGFNLRIALHCGPVHCAHDPLGDRPLFTGPHTSRAARIEPITPPGQVYASSAFAAVAAANGSPFVLSYVGQVPLAKSAGKLGLYHVRGAPLTKAPTTA